MACHGLPDLLSTANAVNVAVALMVPPSSTPLFHVQPGAPVTTSLEPPTALPAPAEVHRAYALRVHTLYDHLRCCCCCRLQLP